MNLHVWENAWLDKLLRPNSEIEPPRNECDAAPTTQIEQSSLRWKSVLRVRSLKMVQPAESAMHRFWCRCINVYNFGKQTGRHLTMSVLDNCTCRKEWATYNLNITNGSLASMALQSKALAGMHPVYRPKAMYTWAQRSRVSS